MKLRINADKVNYDPKTNEYTVDINLQKLGYIFGEPIYCHNIDYGIMNSIIRFLEEKCKHSFKEYYL